MDLLYEIIDTPIGSFVFVAFFLYVTLTGLIHEDNYYKKAFSWVFLILLLSMPIQLGYLNIWMFYQQSNDISLLWSEPSVNGAIFGFILTVFNNRKHLLKKVNSM